MCLTSPISRLLELGFSAVPEDAGLIQPNVDRYVNEPIEERIKCGALVWGERGELVINERYMPIDDILIELSHKNGAQLVQAAEAVAPMSHLIDFRNIGTLRRVPGAGGDV